MSGTLFSKLPWRRKARESSRSQSSPSASPAMPIAPTQVSACVPSWKATSTAALPAASAQCQSSSPPGTTLNVASVRTPRDRGDFNVVIICALRLEAECVYDALDKIWDDKKFGKAPSDDNAYSLGVIGEHNVVIVHLPGMGTDRAAVAAANLRSSFPNIKLALVVGICGGMPHGIKGEEIILGDIIISEALVRYDFGRQYPQGFERKSDIHDILGPPGDRILAVLSKLNIKQHNQIMHNNTTKFLQDIQRKSPEIVYLGVESDILYRSSYVHQHHSSRQCSVCVKGKKICEEAIKADCEDLGCDVSMRISRLRLINSSATQPKIHFGIIGSGNTVMKSGHHRDALANEGIIAVEMEGAGVWRYGPAIVIKGVCDYADTHKRKGWQRYAAATAAACAKAFLAEWTSEQTPSDLVTGEFRKNYQLRQQQPQLVDSPTPVNNDLVTSELSSSDMAILQTLNDFDPQLQLDLVPERNKATLSWLKDAPQLNDWMISSDPSDSVLWVCGAVGCGKSVAAKYMVESVQVQFPRSLVLFFFCDGNNVLRKSSYCLFRSLLYQILSKSRVCADRFFKYHSDKAVLQPDAFEYTWWLRLLLALALLPPETEVFVIIDAIDEIDIKDRQETIERIVNLQLERDRRIPIRRHHPIEVSRATNKMKYLIASRPWQMIADQLGKFPFLEMNERNVSEDIQHYISNEVREFGLKESFPERVMSLIISTIIDKAEAMFVWAHLAWEQFKLIDSDWNQETLDAQLVNLKSLPKGLRSLYKVLLEHLQPSSRALEILEWIMYSARPLLLSELEIAISLKESSISEATLTLPFSLQRSVQRLLGPLVRFQTKDQSFHLCHLSVKEFFENISHDQGDAEIESIRLYKIDVHRTHARLGSACFRYLSFSSVPWGPADGLLDALGQKQISHFARGYKFLEYAAIYWDYHLDIADGSTKSSTYLHSGSISMDRKQQRVRRFWTIKDADLNVVHSCGFRLLHFAVMWGWNSILDILCHDNRTNILSVDDRGYSALFIACWFGFETAANTLVDRGAWRNALEATNTGYNILDLTVKQDMEEVACKILDHLGEITDDTNPRSSLTNEFLLKAITLEWQEALEILVRSHRIRFDIYNEERQGILHLCAKHGIVTVLRQALAAKAEVDERDVHGRTPLHIAVAEESAEIVELLLQSGANSNCTDDDGRAAIHIAMSIDKVHYVQVLLQNGADINQEDAEGRRPVHLAAFWCQNAVFEALLKVPGIDLLVFSSNGNSLIHWAAKGRALGILSKIVRDSRFDRTATGRYARNVLHITAPWASLDLVEDILSIPNLDIGSTDMFGKNALHYAVANPDVRVLQTIIGLSLKHTIDIDLQDKHGRTPLHYACRPGRSAHVETLLTVSAKLTVKDYQGQDAVQIAVAWSALDVLEIFRWSSTRAIIACRPDIVANLKWFIVDDQQVVVSKALELKSWPEAVERIGHTAFSIYRLAAVMGLEDTGLFERWCSGSTELLPVSPFSSLSPDLKYFLVECTLFADRFNMAHSLATGIQRAGDTVRASEAVKSTLGWILRDYWWNENQLPEVVHDVLRRIDVRIVSHQEFNDSMPRLGRRRYEHD